MPPSDSVMRRFWAFVIAVVLGYFFIVVPARLAWRNYWLCKDGQRGIAMVTLELWTGHNAVAYRYRVRGVDYTGSGRRSWQDPKYSKVIVGGNSVVYYSQSHPWLSSLNRQFSSLPPGLPVLIIVWVLEGFLILTALNPNSRHAFKIGSSVRRPPT